VADTLSHHLKEIERKLVQSKKLPDEMYEDPLPKMHVYTRKLRELTLPVEERTALSFDSFEQHVQYAYFIECSEEGWIRLLPLLDIFSRGNRVNKVFGPKAHIMPVPNNRPKVSDARIWHRKCRISHAYNAVTDVGETADILSLDTQVKMKMAPVPVLDEQGNPTGSTVHPKPASKRTTLREEVMKVTVNGKQLFHTLITTVRGDDVGITRVVIPYHPSDPDFQAMQKLARHILNNMAAWFYCYWTFSAGYDPSFVKRLMLQFYSDKALSADECTWDPVNLKVIPNHNSTSDTWLEDNEYLDPSTPGPFGKHSFGITDEARESLLRKLNYKSDGNCAEVNSGVSANTGDDASSGASTFRSETSEGIAMGTGKLELKMKLAKANAELAERDLAAKRELAQKEAEMAELKAKMEEMLRQHHNNTQSNEDVQMDETKEVPESCQKPSTSDSGKSAGC
jgi:hypothetical protein